MIARPVALLLALGIGMTGSQAQPPLSLSRYIASVHAVRSSIDRLARGPVNRNSRLPRIEHRLRALTRVRLPDGRVVDTATPRLADQLGPGDRSSLLRVARSLDSLDEALHRASVVRPDAARLAILDLVLQDPRFHPRRSPLQQLEDWLLQAAIQLLHWARVPTSVVGPGTLVTAILFLLLVAGGGALAARGALRRVVVEAAMTGEVHVPVTSRSAHTESDRLAADGDFRAALRYLVLATMLALQEAGLLELRPGMTNHEYVEMLRMAERRGPEASLGALVDRFDRVWYGHTPLDASGYAACKDLADRALASVRSEDRAA